MRGHKGKNGGTKGGTGREGKNGGTRGRTVREEKYGSIWGRTGHEGKYGVQGEQGKHGAQGEIRSKRGRIGLQAGGGALKTYCVVVATTEVVDFRALCYSMYWELFHVI